MKKFVFGAAALLSVLAGPALARNIAVPSTDPAATVSVPDNWKFSEIEYGYSAISPGKDVFFSVEFATKNTLDAMMKATKVWMKENGIDGSVKPKEVEANFGGLPATVYQFNTKDDNGPTVVEFILMPAGKNRILFVTIWGSDEERAKHGKEIDAIMSSFKAI